MNQNDIADYEAKIMASCEIAFNQMSSNADRQQASVYLQSVGENDAKFLFIAKNAFQYIKKPEVLILFSNLALNTLTKFWGNLDQEFLLNFQAFFIEYLREIKDIPTSVINCVARIPCRIAKLGWLDNDRFKFLTESISTFIAGDAETCNKGLLILSVYVSEVDKGSAVVVSAKQRKIATDFREKNLRDIFALSIEVLRQALDSGAHAGDALVPNALSLAFQCLNFDFIGSLVDESSAEFGSLQIPARWADYFSPKKFADEAKHPTQVVWRVLTGVIGSGAAEGHKMAVLLKSFQVLHSLSMVRRSLFSEDSDKVKYYSFLCDGSIDILERYSGILNDVEAFNNFCRLLISIKNNCPINTLVRMPHYEKWVDLLAKFTATAFKLHGASSNGIHFLLQLWAKFSSSMGYFRGRAPNFLRSFIPQITIEFLEANLNQLCMLMKEGNDFDYLLSEVEMSSIYQFLPSLFLFDYDQSVLWVERKFDAHIVFLKNIMRRRTVANANENKQIQIVEVEISWAIYVVATVISGNIPIGISKEQFRSLDAKLCALIFQVIPFATFRAEMQAVSAIEGTPLLERALLFFFSNFQKSYIQLYISKPISTIGENDFFAILSSVLEKKMDQSELMNIILEKLLSNFCYWYKNNAIIEETLKNLIMIGQGYDSFRTACKSPIIRTVIDNHFSQFQNFMDYPPNGKSRTAFYHAFTKFLFGARAEEVSVEVALKSLLEPFDKELNWLGNQSDCSSAEVVKKTAGVCRDLRGVCRACCKQGQFSEFLDWFQEKHFGTFLMLFEMQSAKPAAVVPMLRFLAELVYNRNARIATDYSSPVGFQLFRSAQKALATYAVRLGQIQLGDGGAGVYEIRIKGMSITMEVLTKLLAGNYVAFGAFDFYGDTSLKEIVGAVMRLVLSLPLDVIYSYQKMSLKYYNLVEILFLKHVELLGSFPEEMVQTMLTSLVDGVQSTADMHSNKAGGALDHLFTYAVTTRTKVKKSPSFQKIEAQLSAQTNTLLTLVTVLFHFVVFDTMSNQFTLTRSLHALLCFNPQMLEFYAKVLVKAQPGEVRERLQELFEPLMQSVAAGNLSSPARDQFTRSIISLRLYVSKASIVPFCR